MATMFSSLSPSSESVADGSTAGIVIPDSWAKAASSIAYGSSSGSSPPITLICGPKNSGKSTFSRFLVNTLLQSYKNVAYLDTDVGQPEFTPPGFVSFHVLEKQIEDFEALSIRTPTRCLYYGDISPKRDPNLYLKGIFQLFDFFLKDFYQIDDCGSPRRCVLPLVINTPGWVKGVGYDLLVEMVKYVSPRHVVQLRISVESKNLPNGVFWPHSEHDAVANVIELYAARRDFNNRSVLVHKEARSLRDARISSYFQQCVPLEINAFTSKELAHALASMTPYEVTFSQIKVKNLHCEVPRNEIFHSLNATIVGLAVSSEENTEAKSWVPWCVGLGIVRGIDIKKDLLYIITPVPLSILEKVDLLLQGFIAIPTSLLQARGCVSPYMARNVVNKLDAREKMQVDA